MESEVRFQIHMKVQDMYRFLLRHAYVGPSGVINVVISAGAFALFLKGAGGESVVNNVLLLLIAAMFTIINPLYLYYKAAKQVKLTPMFLKELEYQLSEQGILAKQGEEELLMTWDQVRKVIETKKDFYIYFSLTRAIIFSKEQFLTQVNEVRSMLKHHVDQKRCKLIVNKE